MEICFLWREHFLCLKIVQDCFKFDTKGAVLISAHSPTTLEKNKVDCEGGENPATFNICFNTGQWWRQAYRTMIHVGHKSRTAQHSTPQHSTWCTCPNRTTRTSWPERVITTDPHHCIVCFLGGEHPNSLFAGKGWNQFNRTAGQQSQEQAWGRQKCEQGTFFIVQCFLCCAKYKI